MRNYGRLAAFLGALLFVCIVVAWQWYVRIGTPQSAAPEPVQAITAAPASPSPVVAARSSGPSPAASPTQRPVVFVPEQQATPVPTPEATASSRPAPGATREPYEASPSAPPEARPMPLVTLAPTAALPGVVREPVDAPPRILALSLNTPVAHGGDVVSGFVETSSNVASVEARIAGYSSAMRKVGVGKFVMSYRVPHLPFFLHRTYSIEVIARNTRGDAVSSSVPITIR